MNAVNHDRANENAMSTEKHKHDAPASVTLAIVTVSTTRDLATDASGQWMRQSAEERNHSVTAHRVIPDDAAAIADTVRAIIQEKAPQVILLTGGTGVGPKDVTIEALRPIFSKELTAFGALFAQHSYDQIGSPAMLSRATAGLIDHTIVFCLPGSRKACQLACERLIFPELGHLVHHLGEK
jgi:molybdenum cofactor biosynthesis protein B